MSLTIIIVTNAETLVALMQSTSGTE